MKQVLVLAIIAGCAAALASVPAAAAVSAPTASVGIVDTERVQAEYKAMQALNQQFMEFQKQQESQLVRRQKSRMLFDDEQREYLDRSAPTAAPTSERDQRLAALEKLSDDRSKRLLELGQKQNRSAEEEQEYQKLDATYKARTQELNDLRTDVERTVQGKSDELMKLIMDSFNTAVKTVAEDKKLALVLRRSVVYDTTGIPVVLYGGTDITEDVITKLNQGSVPQVNLTVPPATVPAASPAAAAPAKSPATAAPATAAPK
jgi:Skp family chaperone for outer membrane proteins